MCYFIYGAVYGNVDQNEYKTIENKYDYKIHCGTKHDVKLAVQEVADTYRVTNCCCDCESDLGKKDVNAEEVTELAAIFEEIKKVDGVKHIYLCKTWAEKRNKSEVKLKLNNIDIKSVLANFKANCLYTFEI